MDCGRFNIVSSEAETIQLLKRISLVLVTKAFCSLSPFTRTFPTISSSEWLELIYPREQSAPQTLQGPLSCGLEQSAYHTACLNAVKGVGVWLSNDVRNHKVKVPESKWLGVFMWPELLYSLPKPQLGSIPLHPTPHPSLKSTTTSLFYGAFLGLWRCFKRVPKTNAFTA